ncbi:MAG: hypothetical protein Q9164_004784 [Protoblastenia rupestris]
MQYSTLTLLALAASINAQTASLPDLTKLPQCAQKSATTGIGSTDCRLTDFTCICKSSAFVRSVGAQIGAVCSPEDQAATVEFANSICQPLGVTIPADGIADEPKKEEEEEPEEEEAPAAAAAAPEPTAAPPAEEEGEEAVELASTYVAPNAKIGAPMTTTAAAMAAGMGAPYPTHHPTGGSGNMTNGTAYGNGTFVPFEGAAGQVRGGVAAAAAVVGAGFLGGLALL